MNKILKNIMRIIGLYIISVIVIVFVFYTMGWYVFNMLPTKIVLLRMLISSITLTIILELLLLLISKIKRIK